MNDDKIIDSFSCINLTCELCSAEDLKVIYRVHVKGGDEVFICSHCKKKVREKTNGVVDLDYDY